MKATLAPVPGLISLSPNVFITLASPFHGLICRRLSDDGFAWNITHHDCYAHQPVKRTMNKQTKYNSVLTRPAKEQSLLGPQTVRMDSMTMLRWCLMAHGTFVTYPHKDANGLCTWIYAHVGVKIWAILEPVYTFPSHDSRESQFELHGRMMHAPIVWEYEEVSKMYTAFLEPGDMMFVLKCLAVYCVIFIHVFSIMPPGTWHCVYTATPTFTDGGHFYLYDALHLTEFSRAFDKLFACSSTNSNHQVDRSLCRLSLALPTVSKRRGGLGFFGSHSLLILTRRFLTSFVPSPYTGPCMHDTPPEYLRTRSRQGTSRACPSFT
jgi:hypothetical protein